MANVYDAAGHRVYRATHGLFMSEGALFVHVLRSDMTEEAAGAALMEWVEAVQREAPGAVMVVVWTHMDTAGADGGRGLRPRVLSKVRDDIEGQVATVGAALRDVEDEIADQMDNSLPAAQVLEWRSIVACARAAITPECIAAFQPS